MDFLSNLDIMFGGKVNVLDTVDFFGRKLVIDEQPPHIRDGLLEFLAVEKLLAETGEELIDGVMDEVDEYTTAKRFVDHINLSEKYNRLYIDISIALGTPKEHFYPPDTKRNMKQKMKQEMKAQKKLNIKQEKVPYVPKMKGVWESDIRRWTLSPSYTADEEFELITLYAQHGFPKDVPELVPERDMIFLFHMHINRLRFEIPDDCAEEGKEENEDDSLNNGNDNETEEH
ncbi:hypothetical protein F4677DRAFT_418596 [Hypoxylon crocopeplum]|nr:hypothetical protein F4677DRAFT_418596 [Hypoxylon crocopeplum]